MGFSCARCVGLIVLIIVVMACAISFVAPYWISYGSANEGLLGTCTGDLNTEDLTDTMSRQCRWFSDEDFWWEKQLKDWQYACQAMFAFGLLLLVIALPCACVSVCCDTYGHVTRTTGSLLILAGVFMSISLIVYGIFVDKDKNITPFYNKSSGKFNWGYYIGITGVIINYIVGGLFFCTHERY